MNKYFNITDDCFDGYLSKYANNSLRNKVTNVQSFTKQIKCVVHTKTFRMKIIRPHSLHNMHRVYINVSFAMTTKQTFS